MLEYMYVLLCTSTNTFLASFPGFLLETNCANQLDYSQVVPSGKTGNEANTLPTTSYAGLHL